MKTPFPVLIANWNYTLCRKSIQSIKNIRDFPCAALPRNWWDICSIRENQNIWNICFFTISGQDFHSCHLFKIQGSLHRQEKFLGGKSPFLHEDIKQPKGDPSWLWSKRMLLVLIAMKHTCLYLLCNYFNSPSKREKRALAVCTCISLLQLLLKHFGSIKNTKHVWQIPITLEELLQYLSSFPHGL